MLRCPRDQIQINQIIPICLHILYIYKRNNLTQLMGDLILPHKDYTLLPHQPKRPVPDTATRGKIQKAGKSHASLFANQSIIP